MRHIQEIFRQFPSLLLVCIAISLCLNIAALSWIFSKHDPQELIVGDAVGYQELAANLAGGKGFGVDTEDGFIQETFRTPGLPALYALFLQMGFGLKAYLFVLSILSAITLPLLSWYIGKNLFIPQVGLITGILLALDPLIFTHNWTLLTEIPFLIVFLGAVALLLRTGGMNITLGTLFSGVLFAFAAYIRPAALPLVILSLISIPIYYLITQKKLLRACVLSLFVMLLCLAPYFVHMERITGVYALSGTGWRNVYTDYLASIRALNNHTRFIDEKENLKQYAMETWGLTRLSINSPSNKERYKAYAIPEILHNWKTVIKLQSTLFITYFTHTDYQRRLQKVSILPFNKVEEGRVSSSRLLIDEGLSAFPKIYKEMENRYFIPVFERIYAVLIFAFAVMGFFVARSPYRYLVLLLLIFGYLTSSAIGLGVEARLRIPILPFYFMLAACGVLFISDRIKKILGTWKS